MLFRSIQSTTWPVQTSTHPVTTSNPVALITVDAMAQVTAILNYCSQVDRPDADKYERALANILSGHASSEMKVDESSPRYGSAARSINLQFASLQVTTVVSACKTFLAGT